MGILTKRILIKRKRYLEDLIADIEKDIVEANRLKSKYQKSLDKINNDLEKFTK